MQSGERDWKYENRSIRLRFNYVSQLFTTFFFFFVTVFAFPLSMHANDHFKIDKKGQNWQIHDDSISS